VHHPVPGVSTQPADLHGLLAHLRRVAALSPDPDSPLNGTLEVQTIGAGTDHVRHIVYLPGTDDLTTLPWTQDGDVRDFAGDLHALAGDRHAYQQGILAAMHRAGIGAHEPVLLVGHSLGGMEAAAILARGSDFDVTHVVTAGSPTAQVDGFPAGSHVLSLEHRGDVVPLLDGSPNPDSVQQTTVIFDAGDGRGGVVAQHEYPAYVAGAAAADASADPSVREQLHSLRAHGFLTGGDRPATPVSSQLFQVVRRS
jgi:pimeloyl-ACP methyl ester carboxylesterase